MKTLKIYITSLAAGIFFGLGLGLSEMTNPERVLGFLDITGNWDGQLLVVLIFAILTHSLFYLFIKKRASPLWAEKFQWPTKKDVDRRLITGAIIFGIGWGLIGYCPGPALASLISFQRETILFVLSMIAGMGTMIFLDRKLAVRFKK